MASDQGSSLPTRRLLLVDDEEDILESLKDLLEVSLEGVEVLPAIDAEEALVLLERHAPHLVVSDFKMPGMSGLELLAEVRRKSPSTTRVLMTAFPDLDVALRAINETRIHAFLAKPLEAADVLRRLADLIRNDDARRESETALARTFAPKPRHAGG